MRKKLLLGSMGVLLLIFLWWLSVHAFIEITPELSKDNSEYSLTDVMSHKSSSFKSAGVIKKLVRKGQYELIARRGETSYLTVVKTKGFLGKSEVGVTLLPEKSRKFVGDSPASCMYYVEKVLASVDCPELYSQLKTHLPATIKQPTIAMRSPGRIDGTLEGIAQTPQGTVVVLRPLNGTNHTGYIAHADLRLSDATDLPDLNTRETYTIQPYKDGFLAYNTSFSRIFYYTSLTARPSVITIKKSGNKKLVPVALKIQGDSILVAYSDNAQDAAQANNDDSQIASKPTNKANTSILVYSGEQTHEYNFKHRIKSFNYCGKDKLCLLDTVGQMETYDVSTNKPRLLSTLDAVGQMEPTNNGVIVALKDGILNFDTDKGSGFLMYNYSPYKFCGMRVDNTVPTLCLVNNAGKSVALLIDPTIDSSDRIDKKIAQLTNQPGIKSLSIYDKIIHVSPELGPSEYLPSLKVFGHDPNALQQTNIGIRQAIDRAGIDKKTYTIVNPYE